MEINLMLSKFEKKTICSKDVFIYVWMICQSLMFQIHFQGDVIIWYYLIPKFILKWENEKILSLLLSLVAFFLKM